MKNINSCRVCLHDVGFPPWGKNGKAPSFAICPCCGCEFGYEDSSAAGIATARARWQKSKGVWFLPEFKPADWDFETARNLTYDADMNKG